MADISTTVGSMADASPKAVSMAETNTKAAPMHTCDGPDGPDGPVKVKAKGPFSEGSSEPAFPQHAPDSLDFSTGLCYFVGPSERYAWHLSPDSTRLSQLAVPQHPSESPEVAELQKKCTLLENKLKDAADGIARLKSQLRETQEEGTSLQAKMVAAEAELDKLRTQHREVRARLEHVEEKLKETEETHTDLREKLAETEGAVKAQDELIERLERDKKMLLIGDAIKRIEMKLMRYVFPDCFKKGFRNSSLANLSKMLEDPIGDKAKEKYQALMAVRLAGKREDGQTDAEYEERKAREMAEVRKRLYKVENILVDDGKEPDEEDEPLSELLSFLRNERNEVAHPSAAFDDLTAGLIEELFEAEPEASVREDLRTLQTAVVKLGIF